MTNLQKKYWPNKQLKSWVEYNNKKEKHGIQITFLKNGDGDKTTHYQNGLKNGLEIIYEYDKIIQTIHYKNGIEHGRLTNYRPNLIPLNELIFENGKCLAITYFNEKGEKINTVKNWNNWEWKNEQ